MNILNLKIDSLSYRRPGLNKISFTASYSTHIRRGTVVYDTVNGKWLTHNSDLDLLVAICEGLRKPNHKVK